ncbi:NAD-dependent epimerase/dehydratase family protein [Legionella gresilensis]|uniref:NAD-dependent epimerase/dehydratase family protein n=1 Tax=Legionella gresilensis TaxID=91823 RepID=UPI0010412F07|nr:NAD-dependent epimerase/dehydratase family protein [Legionella gresilensis]
MKYIITGGCGFVGLNLIQELFKNGVHPGSIKIIDNESVCSRENLLLVGDYIETGGSWRHSGDKIIFTPIDVRDTREIQLATEEADVIIHLAGSTGVVPALKDPLNDCTSNIIGTLNILEAARKNNVKRIIYASSGAPLGDTSPPIHEEKLPNPISPYGASKLACEGYCRAYANCYGLETVILRFGNLYGPFSQHKISLVANSINQVINGRKIEIHGDGSAVRDYLYAPDLARAILIASQKEKLSGDIFQIATGKGVSVNDLMKIMLPILEEFGFTVDMQLTKPRLSDIVCSYADVKKAYNVLGWKPFFDLPQGIRATIEWFIKYKKTFLSDQKCVLA